MSRSTVAAETATDAPIPRACEDRGAGTLNVGPVSAEGGTKRGSESLEVDVADLAHDRDAEDGSIELSLSCVNHEPFALQMRMQRLVRLVFRKAEGAERRSVGRFFDQRRDADLAQRRADAVHSMRVGCMAFLPAAALRELVERGIEREAHVGRQRERRRALRLVCRVAVEVEID